MIELTHINNRHHRGRDRRHFHPFRQSALINKAVGFIPTVANSIQPYKVDRHDIAEIIAEIILKMSLNTNNPNLYLMLMGIEFVSTSIK